jgi:hypothetical protein
VLAASKIAVELEWAFVEFVVKLREVEVVGLKTTQRCSSIRIASEPSQP